MDAETAAARGVGIAAGVGATIAVRDRFDNTGETTILRPSILVGAVTGGLALAAPMFVGPTRGPAWDAVGTYGVAALAATSIVAFNPKSGGSQLPTL